MKKTFKIQLDTELTIDFTNWGLSDAELKGNYDTKKMLINHLLDEYGIDEFEIAVEDGSSLPEVMRQIEMQSFASYELGSTNQHED